MLTCTWCAWANLPGAHSSLQKAITISTGSCAPSGSRKSTTSRSSSARPLTRRRRGSPPPILKPCASTPTGRRAEHGSRRQFNYASPEYRNFCAAIAEQLARRFGHDPNVIGWQIGNEYTDESFDAAHPPPVRGVAPAQIRNARCAESRLGHGLLEPDLRPLGGNSAAHRRRQSRASCSTTAALSAIPGATSSRCRSTPFANTPIRASSSPPTSAASAGATTGTTTRSRARSISPHGTTTWAKGI